MRRYDIASGILLILSIIDFALAAPVLGQEKGQERVDVVHIPKDVISVLGKRWEEDFEKLGEELFKTGGKPVESSSSAPLGADHGSTNVMQPPAQNPASSTANPDPLMEPSDCSSRQGLSARGNCFSGFVKVLSTYGPGGYGGVGPMGGGGLGGLYTPLKEHGYGTWEGANGPQPYLKPTPNSRPVIDPSADPDFPWDFWINAEDPPPRPASPELEIIPQLHKYQPDTQEPPSTSGYGPSPPENENEAVTPPSGSLNLGSPKGPKEPGDEVAPMLLPSADTGLPFNHLSLSSDAQALDPQAAIYAAKGKAKESRRISGTARDVGNVDQQAGERSFDRG